jgi:hypothetical protein
LPQSHRLSIAHNQQGGAKMLTCFIRYEIDPFRVPSFEEYARNWGQIIPRCGAGLIGYFAPHEGSATTAYGVYTVESLAVYEAYRARLQNDDSARQNFEFARRERFILKEDRLFLRLASAPHAPTAIP